MAQNNGNADKAPKKAGGKFIVADRFQRQAPEPYETELEGEELDRFITQKRNAYANEHFLDPVNVMILWD